MAHDYHFDLAPKLDIRPKQVDAWVDTVDSKIDNGVTFPIHWASREFGECQSQHLCFRIRGNYH